MKTRIYAVPAVKGLSIATGLRTGNDKVVYLLLFALALVCFTVYHSLADFNMNLSLKVV